MKDGKIARIGRLKDAKATRRIAAKGLVVAPGFVETEMAAGVLASEEGDSIRNQSSIGRVAQPEELGKTIGFLAFEAPEFMTGSIIDVNGASYLRT